MKQNDELREDLICSLPWYQAVMLRGEDQIWKNSELFASLRTRNYGGYCSACGYQDICGGCRARAAYYHNGDYMAADSYCAYGLQMQEA